MIFFAIHLTPFSCRPVRRGVSGVRGAAFRRPMARAAGLPRASDLLDLRVFQFAQLGCSELESTLSNSICTVQTFSTCPYSSSTGVARPKMDTATFNRARSSSTSSTFPSKEANGPSATRMRSPISKLTDGFGRSTPSCTCAMMRSASESGIGVGRLSAPKETRDLGRVLDEVIGLIRHVHLHQHVAGEELSLRIDLAAAPHLHDLLGRDEDVVDQVAEPRGRRLLADGVAHLLLKIRIGVDDVPALRHRKSRCCQAQPAVPSAKPTPQLMIWSATKKKTVARNTMTKTINVVIAVSRRVGQVTLAASAANLLNELERVCSCHTANSKARERDRAPANLLNRRLPPTRKSLERKSTFAGSPCHDGKIRRFGGTIFRAGQLAFRAVPAERPPSALTGPGAAASTASQAGRGRGLEPPAYGFGDRRSTN